MQQRVQEWLTASACQKVLIDVGVNVTCMIESFMAASTAASAFGAAPCHTCVIVLVDQPMYLADVRLVHELESRGLRILVLPSVASVVGGIHLETSQAPARALDLAALVHSIARHLSSSSRACTSALPPSPRPSRSSSRRSKAPNRAAAPTVEPPPPQAPSPADSRHGCWGLALRLHQGLDAHRAAMLLSHLLVDQAMCRCVRSLPPLSIFLCSALLSSPVLSSALLCSPLPSASFPSPLLRFPLLLSPHLLVCAAASTSSSPRPLLTPSTSRLSGCTTYCCLSSGAARCRTTSQGRTSRSRGCSGRVRGCQRPRAAPPGAAVSGARAGRRCSLSRWRRPGTASVSRSSPVHLGLWAWAAAAVAANATAGGESLI